jgi:hypothetical protein
MNFQSHHLTIKFAVFAREMAYSIIYESPWVFVLNRVNLQIVQFGFSKSVGFASSD